MNRPIELRSPDCHVCLIKICPLYRSCFLSHEVDALTTTSHRPDSCERSTRPQRDRSIPNTDHQPGLTHLGKNCRSLHECDHPSPDPYTSLNRSIVFIRTIHLPLPEYHLSPDPYTSLNRSIIFIGTIHLHQPVYHPSSDPYPSNGLNLSRIIHPSTGLASRTGSIHPSTGLSSLTGSMHSSTGLSSPTGSIHHTSSSRYNEQYLGLSDDMADCTLCDQRGLYSDHSRQLHLYPARSFRQSLVCHRGRTRHLFCR